MLIEQHPGWTVCAEARSERTGYSTYPDVVVIDVSMPDLNGLEVGALLPPLPLPVEAGDFRSVEKPSIS